MLNNLFTNEEFNKILISISIFLIIFLLRTIITYGVLKVFNWKKTKKEIKQIALYDSIKKFITLLGLYIAIKNLNVDEKYMTTIKLGFKILSILIFTIGTANSITAETSFLKKIQDRMKGENTDGMLNVIAKGIKFVIYLIGGFLIITELGYNLNGLAAGLGIGTVVVTLAAQDTAKNLFSSLTIAIDKPFVVGDWIKVAGYEGKVEAITFKSTRIRTVENTIANVPNSLISSDTLVNETKRKRRRYSTELVFSFETSLDKLKDVVAKIDFMLKHDDDVIPNSVNVKFVKIDDNGYKVLVYCFTNTAEYLRYLKQAEYINYQIMEIINKEHVELAYPSSTVYLKQEEE